MFFAKDKAQNSATCPMKFSIAHYYSSVFFSTLRITDCLCLFHCHDCRSSKRSWVDATDYFNLSIFLCPRLQKRWYWQSISFLSDAAIRILYRGRLCGLDWVDLGGRGAFCRGLICNGKHGTVALLGLHAYQGKHKARGRAFRLDAMKPKTGRWTSL